MLLIVHCQLVGLMNSCEYNLITEFAFQTKKIRLRGVSGCKNAPGLYHIDKTVKRITLILRVP